MRTPKTIQQKQADFEALLRGEKTILQLGLDLVLTIYIDGPKNAPLIHVELSKLVSYRIALKDCYYLISEFAEIGGCFIIDRSRMSNYQITVGCAVTEAPQAFANVKTPQQKHDELEALMSGKISLDLIKWSPAKVIRTQP